jgi:hypothetical protein
MLDQCVVLRLPRIGLHGHRLVTDAFDFIHAASFGQGATGILVSSERSHRFPLPFGRGDLQKPISEGKDDYYGCVHCNDEPKQNTSLNTQPLYFISGPSKSP